MTTTDRPLFRAAPPRCDARSGLMVLYPEEWHCELVAGHEGKHRARLWAGAAIEWDFERPADRNAPSL